MAKRMRVCRNCKRFTEEKSCTVCKSTDLSPSWKGLVIIMDAQTSEIAKVMNIGENGSYAVYVG